MRNRLIIILIILSSCSVQSEVLEIEQSELADITVNNITVSDDTDNATSDDENGVATPNNTEQEYQGSVKEMLITSRNDTLFTPISFATIIIYDENMVQVGDRTFSAFRDGTFSIESTLLEVDNNYVVEVINDKNISETMEIEFSNVQRTEFINNGIQIVMIRDERSTSIDEVRPVRMLFNNPRSIQIN